MEKIVQLNRIRVVLAEKNVSNRWLAERLGRNEMTVSRWCTNRSQPNMAQLFEIADILEVEPKDLLESLDTARRTAP